MVDTTVEVTADVSVEPADKLTHAFLLGMQMGVFGASEDGPEPCDGCGCALSDSDRDTETIELPAYEGLSTKIREYLEGYTEISDDDIVSAVTVCPQQTTVHVQRG